MSKASKNLEFDARNDLAFAITPGSAVIPQLVKANGRWTIDNVKQCMGPADEEMRALGDRALDAMPKAQVKHGPFKEEHKINDKIMREKNGDFAQLTDAVRMTITVDNIEDLAFISNNLNPRTNPEIIHIEDSFARPNKENGQKRMKILMQTENGLIAEIMVRHAGLDQADAITRNAYEVCKKLRQHDFNSASHATLSQEENTSTNNLLRGIEDDIENLGYNDFFDETVNFEGKTLKETNELCQLIRQRLPEALSEELGLDDIVIQDENRTFYEVGGMPVVIMTDPYQENKQIAIRPDLETNSYVIDNSYLDQIYDRSRSTICMTDYMSLSEARDKFIEESVKKVNNYNTTKAELSSTDSGADIISLERVSARRALEMA